MKRSFGILASLIVGFVLVASTGCGDTKKPAAGTGAGTGTTEKTDDTKK